MEIQSMDIFADTITEKNTPAGMTVFINLFTMALFDLNDKMSDMEDWSADHALGVVYIQYPFMFFEYEADAIEFKLRWL